MPQTAQHVADEFGVSRADQDAFALRSQERAAAAVSSGRLSVEIVPITTSEPQGRRSKADVDEHPRNTSAAKLASLRPLFPGGSVTAGNSSGVNDGACALILASEGALDRYGLTPLARIVGSVSVGVQPRIMGIGPDPAVRSLLQRHGLDVADIDLFELNEAFASQALAVLRALGLPDDAPHVNPNGGAIALGHPLGASGARLVLTAALEVAGQRASRAMAAMCVGVGQGTALLLERP
jgi:acetyl-CoA acetyltransferase family protein